MNKLVHYIAGRDSVGIRPLYTNKNSFDTIDIFSSEMKGMSLYKDDIMEFPPGIIRKTIIIDNIIGEYNFAKYLYENIYEEEIIPLVEDACMIVNSSAINSISRRLTADRPIAFLLSGGVDSSLVCAISMSLLKIPIRTFCCGIKGSTDMKFAKMVATYIGSIHTEIYFTEEEGLAVIDDVIYTTNDLFKLGIDARGWKCAAGQESITINGDGNVFHCGIHMTNFIRDSQPETPYTNLVTDKLAVTKLSILYKTGTTCRWDYCGGDFYLSRTPGVQSS
jgi:hypothetical protein